MEDGDSSAYGLDGDAEVKMKPRFSSSDTGLTKGQRQVGDRQLDWEGGEEKGAGDMAAVRARHAEMTSKNSHW